MEWFVAVLDDLERNIFFVGQPWWPDIWRNRSKEGGRREGKGMGGERRVEEGRGGKEMGPWPFGTIRTLLYIA